MYALCYDWTSWLLLTILVVQVEQSLRSVSVCLYVRAITFELNDLWATYLASWFMLTLSRSQSKAKAIRRSSRQRMKKYSFFSYGCMLLRDLCLGVCWVLRDKVSVVGATSIEVANVNRVAFGWKRQGMIQDCWWELLMGQSDKHVTAECGSTDRWDRAWYPGKIFKK